MIKCLQLQSSNRWPALPMIPFDMVAYAFTLLQDNLFWNSCIHINKTNSVLYNKGRNNHIQNETFIAQWTLPSSAIIKWLLSSSIKQANTSKPLALKSATSALRSGTSTFTAWQAAKFVLIGTRFDKLWRFPKILESILPREVYLERYCVLGFCLIEKHPCKLSYNTTYFVGKLLALTITVVH